VARNADNLLSPAERAAVARVLAACRDLPGKWLYAREVLAPAADGGKAVRAWVRARGRADFPHGLLDIAGGGMTVRMRAEVRAAELAPDPGPDVVPF
jgi:hypothetical protein